jgi:methionyl-tRNA formyltransferase
MYIKCKDSYIAVTRVKMQDKKAIGIKDFYNGYRDLAGEVLKGA